MVVVGDDCQSIQTRNRRRKAHFAVVARRKQKVVRARAFGFVVVERAGEIAAAGIDNGNHRFRTGERDRQAGIQTRRKQRRVSNGNRRRHRAPEAARRTLAHSYRQMQSLRECYLRRVDKHRIRPRRRQCITLNLRRKQRIQIRRNRAARADGNQCAVVKARRDCR